MILQSGTNQCKIYSRTNILKDKLNNHNFNLISNRITNNNNNKHNNKYNNYPTRNFNNNNNN